jgi:hypothetical protein
MLFLGHFSFDARAASDSEPWHGLFTCVVEAKDVRDAVARFRRLIRSLAKRDDAFEGVDEIYLDSCIEVRALPRTGLLSFITIRQGEDIGGISASLLGIKAQNAVNYRWASPDDDEEQAEPRRMEPFVRLRRQAQTRAGRTATPPDTPPLPRSGGEKIH